MSRKRRSTFALSNSCRVIRTRRGRPRFGFVAEITQMEAAGLWEADPLCRLQLLNLHSLPDEFHFLLHYFLFTSQHLSLLFCFFFFFYKNYLLHSFDESILCSDFHFSCTASRVNRKPGRCASQLPAGMSLFYQGTSSECRPPCPLCPRVPDVDSISEIFLSNVGTHVSILTLVMQMLRDLKAVNFLHFTKEGQRMWKGKRNPAGTAMSPVYFLYEWMNCNHYAMKDTAVL